MAEETTKNEDAYEVKEFSGGIRDCAIIGGGPAGLSAALYMGRMRRSVVVVDDYEGRSTWHQVNRNYLGFPDGVHATALRELGEWQAAKYGAEFLRARAITVEMSGAGRERRFTISTSKAIVEARTLILATGVCDKFPEFEGSEECIGKSMFWCIICDGYEAIGKKLVVLGHNERAVSLALEMLVFTQDVTLISWDAPFDIPQAKMELLKEHKVRVINTSCNFYKCGEGQITALSLADGTEVELETLFVAQWIEPNTQLANQLNLALDRHGYILADTEQTTNIEGVFAAGDVTRLHNHQVTSAVHEGGMAAAAANYYLYEDWQKE